MKKEKKKILVVGDLVTPTGFSRVLHNVIKYNLDEFDITGLGVNYRGDPHEYNFPIYPAQISPQGSVYGIDRLVNIINSVKFDVVFILNDAWVIGYYLDAIKKYVKEVPPIIVYFPVDSNFHNRAWYKDFDIVRRAFTYTEYGRGVVQQAVPEISIGIIPHGIDSGDFYKAYPNKADAKKALYGGALTKMGNAEDLFFVLNANRNQPRKRLDITIHGFSLFAKNKPETVRLYMHSGVRDSHIDIRLVGMRYGVDNRIIVTSLNPGVQKVSIQELNAIYNACDVGINTSMGEGWGLTNVEHAVTGALQIVPDFSASSELFADCGLLMDTITDYTFDNSQTVGRLTTPEEVARCLEIAYSNKELREELALKSMRKFMQPEYQWRTIAKTFAEAFNEVIEEDVTTPISSEHTPTD